jgi:DNA polymerase-3 subunit gamma/tau
MSDESIVQSSPGPNERHLVVALKYRPQTFQSLVGQDHIATALGNAIRQNRVGHAYLFTGARVVGKTSSARIFTKCLNCEKGPSPVPCEECETCQAISVGEDVDVIEIDGASNRGIDEIRQLRANAAVRPSRSANKIYIIDEVHMLTKEAFNALLKTLEEPPSHVKFIFCTTDPEKIPITVLSRCQRFDFSPVQTTEIAERLKLIATEEGVAIDDQALALLARRANGSMRDSQSLLEQMLSFCDTEISVDDVHQLLGTADIGRIADVAQAMASKDSALALNLIHEGIFAGIDAGQMANQLLGYFRDMMAVRVGSNEETLLNCSPQDMPTLKQLADQFGLETILTITQIFDSTVVKMQHSLHGRTLLEVATVRVCNLEHLDSMSDLVASLRQGGGATTAKRPRVQPSGNKMEMRQVEVAAPKKKQITESPSHANSPTPSPHAGPSPSAGPSPASISAEQPVPAVPPTAASPAINQPAANGNSSPPTQKTAGEIFKTQSASQVWQQVTQRLDGMTSDMAKDFQKVELAEPHRLVVTLSDKVNKDFCSKPDRKQQIESFLAEVTGEPIKIEFLAGRKPGQHAAHKPKLTRVQQIRQLESNNFVSDAISIFDAEITGFKEGRRRS